MNSIFKSNREVRILLIGLDGAGKTTLLYKLKLNQTVPTVPTVGFNVEDVQYRNIKFRMWDVGGQDKIRALWRYYFQGSQAIIFMVDSADNDRLEEAGKVLNDMLADDLLRDTSVLVFANKQDLPNAASKDVVAASLGLYSFPPSRKWGIFSSNALSGEGLHEGLEWLSNNLPVHKI